MIRPRAIDEPGPAAVAVGSGRAWASLGWAMALTGVAVAVAMVATEAWFRRRGLTLTVPGTTLVDDLVFACSWLGFPVVGAVVLTRQPDNRVGRLLVGLGAAAYLGLTVDNVARVNDLMGGPRTVTVAAAIAAPWIYPWLLLLVPLLLAHFPSGTIRSPLVARAQPFAIGAMLLVPLTRTLRPGPLDSAPIANPFGLPIPRGALTALLVASTWVVIAFGLLALVDLLRRWRRSDGIERAQIRWFVAAGCLFPTLFLVGILLIDVLGQRAAGQAVILAAFLLGMVGMAVAIGVAVLRYRLYEIDRIVSRTVTYAGVVAILVGVYAVSVITLQTVLRPLTGESDLAVAGSTLVVAALSGPVRRRVRTFIDRRFDRARYDAARAVAAFGQRLRDEVDLDEVAQELRHTVASTLAPAGVSLWLPPTAEVTR